MLPYFILQVSSPISRFTKDFGQFLCRSAYEQLDIKVCSFVSFEFDLFEPKCLNWVLPKIGRKGAVWVILIQNGADSWHWKSFRRLLRYSKKKSLIMTSTQIIEASVTILNHAVLNYNHPDGHFQST